MRTTSATKRNWTRKSGMGTRFRFCLRLRVAVKPQRHKGTKKFGNQGSDPWLPNFFVPLCLCGSALLVEKEYVRAWPHAQRLSPRSSVTHTRHLRPGASSRHAKGERDHSRCTGRWSPVHSVHCRIRGRRPDGARRRPTLPLRNRG